MFTRSTPAGVLALLVVLILGIVACSSPQPADEAKPPLQEETETGDRESDSDAPEGDPVGEDADDDHPLVDDGDNPTDENGNRPDDEDNLADGDDETAGPPEDEEDDAGLPDDDKAGPSVQVSKLRTVLRAHTAVNDAGAEETVLILTANIELVETAKEATQLTITLLTGDGSESGTPYLLDIAAGESSAVLTADGHDWGTFTHGTYRVSVASAGEPTVNEHDLSWLPGGLSLPSDLAITMTSPTQMDITFEPVTEARIHYVTASYASADETLQRIMQN